MREGSVEANGLRFGILEDGPEDGPLALCLHGFPDSAWTWRHLLPDLASAGFRAAAPFMRGYAPTEIPSDGHFQTGALGRDANALHGALGGDERAVLIGHDWGAMATYAAAAHRPTRWRRAVGMAVPPAGSVMGSFFNYDQLRRSWYTFFFQTGFAEMVLPMDDYAFLGRLWADWSPGYEASYDVARVKEAIGTPERIVAAISYYRELYDGSRHDPDLADEQAAAMANVPVPTLYLHGADDACFKIVSMEEPLEYLATGSEAAIVGDAGHFLHLEQPAEVNRRIISFITA